MAKTLSEIVRDEDLESLEGYAISAGKYSTLMKIAEREGIDLEHLEELLSRI